MKILTALLLTTCLTTISLSAHSKAAFGVGLAYVFGDGLGISVKLFSSDKEDKAAASLGLDFVVKDKSFRPNVGIAYVGKGYYADLSAGYNLQGEDIDWAVGAGWADSKAEEKSATTNGQAANIATTSIGASPDPIPIVDTDLAI